MWQVWCALSLTLCHAFHLISHTFRLFLSFFSFFVLLFNFSFYSFEFYNYFFSLLLCYTSLAERQFLFFLLFRFPYFTLQDTSFCLPRTFFLSFRFFSAFECFFSIYFFCCFFFFLSFIFMHCLVRVAQHKWDNIGLRKVIIFCTCRIAGFATEYHLPGNLCALMKRYFFCSLSTSSSSLRALSSFFCFPFPFYLYFPRYISMSTYYSVKYQTT